jgi:hypothetical protein
LSVVVLFFWRLSIGFHGLRCMVCMILRDYLRHLTPLCLSL